MPLTEAEKAKIRMYMGWSPRFHQFDTALEQAINVVDNLTEVLTLIQNPLAGSPPGVLAVLEDIDAKILAAHSRLKATKVGSIATNPDEVRQLRDEGSLYGS